ncbi:MAG: hypothetical protein M1828_002711, partial [Chrysothrix sp. TS-e1954]
MPWPQCYGQSRGVATITDFITGTREVFGMASDLATILAAYGAVLDGAGVLWSIAGSEHIGIGGSHNNYETDSSPLRGDLAQYGSNTRLIMSQFYELYNMQPDAASANYDLSVLRDFRGVRFNESINKNPNFFCKISASLWLLNVTWLNERTHTDAPFSGTAVSQAAFSFIFRFMGNKSAEHPTGVLNKDVLKSFMSVSGPEDNLQWTPGHERIPENWYSRNEADYYSLDYFGEDIKYLAATQPQILTSGCNTGAVNTFTPINTTALTGSAYTPADVLANPLCYGLAYANAQAGFLGVVNSVLGELILPIQNTLGCKTIPSLNMSVAMACPGYSLYGGPTGDVAKGA